MSKCRTPSSRFVYISICTYVIQMHIGEVRRQSAGKVSRGDESVVRDLVMRGLVIAGERVRPGSALLQAAFARLAESSQARTERPRLVRAEGGGVAACSRAFR